MLKDSIKNAEEILLELFTWEINSDSNLRPSRKVGISDDDISVKIDDIEESADDKFRARVTFGLGIFRVEYYLTFTDISEGYDSYLHKSVRDQAMPALISIMVKYAWVTSNEVKVEDVTG